MASNPRVLELLEEMLDAGKTPEEVCRDCPELLPEVRQRWQAFRLIDAQVGALYRRRWRTDVYNQLHWAYGDLQPHRVPRTQP